ncbi:MAG TPA: flagellar biosynthetic protein FlhB, partial [Cellvibrionales bacterium]|nr:flagellar biosynthetic protein FlhB [Cellvibrionales bacterium]
MKAMAEEENGQEKTEDATFKRLEKAREEGQVARSRELGTTLLLMTGGFSVLIFGATLSRQIQSVMLTNFDFDRVSAMDPSRMLAHLSVSVEALLSVVGIILFLLMLAGAFGAIGLGGWIFSAKPMQPKLSRLNPIAGLKR